MYYCKGSKTDLPSLQGLDLAFCIFPLKARVKSKVACVSSVLLRFGMIGQCLALSMDVMYQFSYPGKLEIDFVSKKEFIWRHDKWVVVIDTSKIERAA